MTSIDIYRERLDIQFSSPTSRGMSEYILAAKSTGLTWQGDLFVLNRHGTIPPWQHESIVECAAFLSGKEVFGKRGKWDMVVFSFLFASIPEAYWNDFIITVYKFSSEIGINPTFKDKIITSVELNEGFISYKNELNNKFNLQPGSEELAIIIQSSYPR